MQVRGLIEKLKQFDPDTEVYMYTWDGINYTSVAKPVTELQFSESGRGGVYVLTDAWPECMMGEHDNGCMCNLGFIPRWRNING